MKGAPFRIDASHAIGLIPARGGSKSIPLKNIVPVAGRPLISYVITAGLRANTLSRLVCSTDNLDIADLCRNYGVEVIERPSHLGEDDTPVTAVILHVLDTLAAREGCMPGMVALLQPTSPFLLTEHIDACVLSLRANSDADSVQTITTFPHNYHAFNQRVIEGDRVRFCFEEERRKLYNKQLKPKHYIFGNLVVTRAKSLLQGKGPFGEYSLYHEITLPYAVDVDGPDDIEYAEYLLRTGKVKLL